MAKLVPLEDVDSPFCFWRDAAWHHALPYRDYVATPPGMLERA